MLAVKIPSNVSFSGSAQKCAVSTITSSRGSGVRPAPAASFAAFPGKPGGKANLDHDASNVSAGDVADHIETAEDAVHYPGAVLLDGDAGEIAEALGVVARSQGMATIAEESGLSRETLYRTLSDAGNPGLATLIGVLRAMGLRLSVTADEVVRLGPKGLFASFEPLSGSPRIRRHVGEDGHRLTP